MVEEDEVPEASEGVLLWPPLLVTLVELLMDDNEDVWEKMERAPAAGGGVVESPANDWDPRNPTDLIEVPEPLVPPHPIYEHTRNSIRGAIVTPVSYPPISHLTQNSR